MYHSKKMLVTGAAGFIGCNFVRYILQNYPEIKVVSLDKITYAGSLKNLENLPHEESHTFIQGDICNSPLLREIFVQHEIDTVVHFAAESHVDRSISQPSVFLETNIQGTFHLLENARRRWIEELKWSAAQCRFHHISTDEVYGSLGTDDDAFTELTPYAPNSPYSASKAASDHLVRAWFHTYGLPVTTSHCSNNYGPYQHAEKLIPTVISSCIKRTTIPVYGNGGNVRDWLHVGDHCEAVDLIIRKGLPGEAYNIGGGTESTNLDIIRRICLIMDDLLPMDNGKFHRDLVSFVQDRPGHDWRYAINNFKIHNALGWQPMRTLDDGLLETVQFYLNLYGINR